jgi:CRP/FNR family transcriptional regulator, nitrogen oxide reductase regulator
MGAQPLYPFRPAQAGASPNASVLEERVNLLTTSPLCSGLSHDEIIKIASCARPKAFARDETLFIQGQPAKCLLLIRTGAVKITQISSNGNEVILWMYGRGNVLGVLSDPASDIHPSSARAMEPTTALLWDCASLQSLMDSCPRIRQNLSQVLLSRLAELEERFREVATEKVPRRLALALLRLSKHVGKKVHEGIEVSLSREELAQMTGTTLFTISRILSQWSKEDFLTSRRESVLLRDPRRLEYAGCEA